MNLYQNIKTRRIEIGMTQDELAEKLGYCGRSMITKIEAGKVDLTQSRILAFAKALDIDPGELMGWDEPYVANVNPLEYNLLKYFRELDDEGQKVAVFVVEGMKMKYKRKDK